MVELSTEAGFCQFDIPDWASWAPLGRLDTWHTTTETRATKTQNKSFADFISAIRTDNEHKRRCRAFSDQLYAMPERDRKDENGPYSKKTAEKGQCPFWSIAADHVASDAVPNGLRQLDFDDIADNADVERAKTIVSGLGCALMVAYSVSGHGIFAIVYAPEENDVEALYNNYLKPVSDILRAEGIAHNPDRGALGVGHGRIEAYDPKPYVATEIVAFDVEAVGRLAAKARQKMAFWDQRESHPFFYAHPISQIADAFRGRSSVGGIATAAALAFVGAHVNVFSKTEYRSRAYAARPFIVALGNAGEGKTSIMDAIVDTRKKARCAVGYVAQCPKSDAALAEILKRAGSRIQESTDAGGKAKKQRVPIDDGESPQNTLILMDEGGKFLKSVAKNEKCGDMDSALCKAFNEFFTLPMTKGGMDENEGLERVQANTTLFICATPKQWVEYAATEEEENGMIRRRLIFADVDEKPETPAKTLFEKLENNPHPDTSMPKLGEYAEKLARIPQKQAFLVTTAALQATARAISALNAAEIPESAHETLIINYATLCAVARCALTGCRDYTVTPADMEAVTDILSESVCRARAQIAEKVEMAGAGKWKSENQIWKEIRDYLDGGGKRKDKCDSWLNRKPPVYRDVFGKMIARGEVTTDTAKDASHGRIYRLATDEERAKYTEKHEKAARDAGLSVFDGGTHTQGPQGPRQPKKPIEERIQTYIEKARADMNPSANDNSLRALAGTLKQSQLYAEDKTAVERAFYAEVTSGRYDATGRPKYTSRDARRLFRDGGLTKIKG